MSSTRRTFLKGLASLAGAAAIPTLAGTAAPQLINYGGSAWLGHYPAYIGVKSGLFAAKGVDVKWQSFGTSSARMSAVLSGGVDIACTGIVSALALMSRGSRHFSLVAVPDDFGRVEGLFSRSDVTSLQGLKGKKIGVTFASSSHLLVLDLLTSAGLSPDTDVVLLNVPAPELPAALQSRQIDAAAAWTPQFNKIRSMPDVKLLADDTGFSLHKKFGLTPGPDVLVVRREFGTANPEATRRFLQAYFEASMMLRDKPEKAATYLTELTNLPLADQIAAVKDATWYSAADQQNLLKPPAKFIDGLQSLANMLVSYKQIDKSPIVSQWVDTSYL
ncbi:MAG: ABC transporter substrate-binding protein [Proteobacteria bacterium]|nr:ABC transporter substrate-binding protein [Pseudomonadota bacterium]